MDIDNISYACDVITAPIYFIDMKRMYIYFLILLPHLYNKICFTKTILFEIFQLV